MVRGQEHACKYLLSPILSSTIHVGCDQIGGGLALGLEAIGGGIYAHHKKKEDEEEVRLVFIRY